MRRSKVYVQESTRSGLLEQSRIRLLCVGLFFALCYASVGIRLVDVAVRQPAARAMITVSDDERSEQVDMRPAKRFSRGDIVDRHGMLLATNVMTASMFANPNEIRDAADTARKLEKILALDAAQTQKRLMSGKSFVWIKRNLTPREQNAVNMLGIPGLYFLPEERRVYPYGRLLSHTVGYVGIDNRGLAGIEKFFDSRLRDEAQNRAPLALSMDIRLQSLMHEEIHAAMRRFRAQSATGVIMEVRSGEVMAMVSLPDFDPHRPAQATEAERFSRASLGAYEMGSTFKTFTMAMALENGEVTLKSGYDAASPLKISSYTIRDAHPEGRWLSVPEIYAFSSNIGTAKMALDVGGKRQKAFLEKMGMLEPLSIELPERAVPLYPKDWKEINTVTISYGQGISVSPLHLARGVAGLVADGELPRLTLIKDGNRGREAKTSVISERASRDVRRLMRLVVDHGTGGKADVPGYRVGGKTGTAEKPHQGGYDEDSKIASFIAVFPVDDPKYVVLVMIDEPKGDTSTYGQATGGWISAPVAGNIISRMGPLLGMKPRFDVPEDDAEKFWVSAKKTGAGPPVAAKYVHAASY